MNQRELNRRVWIDSSSETFVVVCELCHRHEIFLTKRGADGWAKRHRAVEAETDRPECSDPDCSRPAFAKTMCSLHYRRDERDRKRAAA